ncbi:hypothetical protein [Clostridium sp. Marseille-Q7071]
MKNGRITTWELMEKRGYFILREKENYIITCATTILNKLNNNLMKSIKNKDESSSIACLKKFLKIYLRKSLSFKVKVINNAIAIFMRAYEKMGDWGFLYNVYAVTYYIKHEKF